MQFLGKEPKQSKNKMQTFLAKHENKIKNFRPGQVSQVLPLYSQLPPDFHTIPHLAKTKATLTYSKLRTYRTRIYNLANHKNKTQKRSNLFEFTGLCHIVLCWSTQ